MSKGVVFDTNVIVAAELSTSSEGSNLQVMR